MKCDLKNNIILFGIIGIVQFAAAQCPTELNIHTQSEIDSFPIKYPNCKVISHRVSINATPPLNLNSDIKNLNGLLSIDSIGEHLWIYDVPIKNLRGLDSLKFVGGGIYLGLDSLQNLEGLGNLTAAGGITIDDQNKNLLSTKGIEKLKSCGSIELDAPPNLKSLEGFSGLDTMNTRLRITGTKINDLHGLENLRCFGFGGVALLDMLQLKSLAGLDKLDKALLNIENCDSLQTLSGLNAYKTSYSITLSDNDRLNSLDGLENLEKFEWFFSAGIFLENNPVLEDLNALDRSIPMQLLEIKNNSALSICSVQSICDFLSDSTHQASIIGNSPNCNSDFEILSFCTSSTEGASSKKSIFKISPNPLTNGSPLQIYLENDHIGRLKIEIWSLEGRLIQTIFLEKSEGAFTGQVPISGNWPEQFVLRVSDNNTSVTRLVFKHL
jgi:hypothetical protein